VSHRFRFEQWVPVPLADVFRFFSDPANLPRIMPPELDAKLVGVRAVPPPSSPPRADPPDAPAAAGVGSEIVVSVRLVPMLPIRILWVARITEFEAASRDGREGTLVRDVLEYEIGFGALGRLAQRLFVGGQMQRTFEHRQRTLERLLGVS